MLISSPRTLIFCAVIPFHVRDSFKMKEPPVAPHPRATALPPSPPLDRSPPTYRVSPRPAHLSPPSSSRRCISNSNSNSPAAADSSMPTRPISNVVLVIVPHPIHLRSSSINSSRTNARACRPIYSSSSNHCKILNKRCRCRVLPLPPGAIMPECCRAWYLPRAIVTI